MAGERALRSGDLPAVAQLGGLTGVPAEFRQAEGMAKPILCARIETFAEGDFTTAWQRCDLFGDGPTTAVDIGDGQAPVRLLDSGLQRLLTGLRSRCRRRQFRVATPRGSGPVALPGLAATRIMDAAVYFGRDAQIVRALDDCADACRRPGADVRHPRSVRGRQVVVSACRPVAPARPRRPAVPDHADGAAGTSRADR